MRALAALLVFVPSLADANECKIVELDFTPAQIALPGALMKAPSQIVAWLEDTNGRFVDTIMITQSVGAYGLGNRPGRHDFNSGPLWPYGRRTAVFPIWAHRRAASGAPVWQELVFQDGHDEELSHAAKESTQDSHYCRPLQSDEATWDTGTCATQFVGTDKGVFHPLRVSLYPPRNDHRAGQFDSADVPSFDMLNPFDAVSMATPPSGVPATIGLLMPDALANGNYILWFEISREFDHNATYSVAAYPSPNDIPWQAYGEAYRGQPSTLYKVPFTIGPPVAVASTLDYVGYGAPDGADGDVRPPDATITTGVAGSGAERLAIRADGGDPFRLRVNTRVERDDMGPSAPTSIDVNTLTRSSATIEFTAPGDDALVGRVRTYEIRYVAGNALDESTFPDAIEILPEFAIETAGTLQEFTIDGLLFDTEYTVGVRALDDCRHTGPLATLTFRTPERGGGEVDACFIATATYGSVLADDVVKLRSFRDTFLSSTVLGELAIETYYTFGPVLAGVIGESELLRATARAMISPLLLVVAR